MSKKLLTSLIGATLVAASSNIAAYEAGEIVLRVGAALVEPNEDSSDLDITAPALGAVSGGKVGVDNNLQLGLNLTYMFSDHLGVGVLGATPFSHDIYAAGKLGGVGKLGSTMHLPPTVTLQYYLPFPNSNVQVHVGAGLNYTAFFSEDTTDTLTNSIGTLAQISNTPTSGVVASSTKMDLEDSFGIAMELGFDLAINENFGLSASLFWVDIDTEATVTAQTNVGEVKANVDVDIDPFVYMVGVNFRF